MQKIPTLFKREFIDRHVVKILPEVTPGLEWVLLGGGIPTVKYDGACCAIIDGVFYKRYDAKRNKDGIQKSPPPGAIPCCDPDPVTGHWPHWVKIDAGKPEDRWFIEAYINTGRDRELTDGTYEAVGPHFQGNPYHLNFEHLIKHGEDVIRLPDRSFEAIREYLQWNHIEGIVFWKDGKPECKIKRSDFGFPWPILKC